MILTNWGFTPLSVSCTGLAQAPPDFCYYFETIPGGIQLYEGGIHRGTLVPDLSFPHHHIMSPEPGTLALLGAGLLLLWRLRKR
jgi:hypothetical protein